MREWDDTRPEGLVTPSHHRALQGQVLLLSGQRHLRKMAETINAAVVFDESKDPKNNGQWELNAQTMIGSN